MDKCIPEYVNFLELKENISNHIIKGLELKCDFKNFQLSFNAYNNKNNWIYINTEAIPFIKQADKEISIFTILTKGYSMIRDLQTIIQILNTLGTSTDYVIHIDGTNLVNKLFPVNKTLYTKFKNSFYDKLCDKFFQIINSITIPNNVTSVYIPYNCIYLDFVRKFRGSLHIYNIHNINNFDYKLVSQINNLKLSIDCVDNLESFINKLGLETYIETLYIYSSMSNKLDFYRHNIGNYEIDMENSKTGLKFTLRPIMYKPA
jgi:hypothetical protein